MSSGFGDLATKGDLDMLRTATKADIDGLRAELKGDINGLRAELKVLGVEHDALRHELLGAIDRSARRLMAWVSTMVLATAGLAFTAGHLL